MEKFQVITILYYFSDQVFNWIVKLYV